MRLASGDHVQVKHVYWNGKDTQEEWRDATVVRDDGWRITVAYADHTRQDVERKQMRQGEK